MLAAAAAAALLPTGLRAATPLNVVATTGMIADTVREIGGDAVEVRALMGPGVDPHAYRQTRTDILAMSRADLIVANGLFLEAQMEDVLGDFAARTAVLAAAEAVPESALFGHEDYAGKFDPHVWMDPELWDVVAQAIRDALIEVRPEAAPGFTSRAAAFTDRLRALDAYSAEVLGSVAEPSRVLVTAHDAFAYFGSAYGWEVMGIQGISTESEAGLQRISELVDMLVERGIGAVFVESSVSDRNIRALIEGAAAQGHEVRIGGELYSDAMGAPGTYEGTFIGMIDHNVTTIAAALGGSAPERGMAGLLGHGS
ncbi:MAG: zinc ABC transporter substrate-binding protein [Paracoccaceae bacterium]|nr:zinc ABC transporter substrate-binding protein [Paracoccaceae bacterium]